MVHVIDMFCDAPVDQWKSVDPIPFPLLQLPFQLSNQSGWFRAGAVDCCFHTAQVLQIKAVRHEMAWQNPEHHSSSNGTVMNSEHMFDHFCSLQSSSSWRRCERKLKILGSSWVFTAVAKNPTIQTWIMTTSYYITKTATGHIFDPRNP